MEAFNRMLEAKNKATAERKKKRHLDNLKLLYADKLASKPIETKEEPIKHEPKIKEHKIKKKKKIIIVDSSSESSEEEQSIVSKSSSEHSKRHHQPELIEQPKPKPKQFGRSHANMRSNVRMHHKETQPNAYNSFDVSKYFGD